MILRVYGQATTSHPRDADREEKVADFPGLAGSRRIFDPRLDLVRTCRGSGVPIMRFMKNRGGEEMVPFCEQTGLEGVTGYRQRRNTLGIDGMATAIFDDD